MFRVPEDETGRRCFPQSRPGTEASTPPPCTATRQQWARRSPAAACHASSCSSRPGPAGHTPGSRCPPARSPRQSQSAPGPAQTRRPAGRVPVARGLGKARAGRPRRLLRYGRLARGVHGRLSSGAGPGHQVHQGIGDRGDFPGADVRVPGRLAVPGAAEGRSTERGEDRVIDFLTWEPVSGIEPLTCRLQDVRSFTLCALAAPMAQVIARMALAALGLSRAPFHEPFHADGRQWSMTVTERSDGNPPQRHLNLTT